jgi:hypothetical protein
MSFSPINAVSALDPAETENLAIAARNLAHPPLAESDLALAGKESAAVDELGSTPSVSLPGLSEDLASARLALQTGDISAAEADLNAVKAALELGDLAGAKSAVQQLAQDVKTLSVAAGAGRSLHHGQHVEVPQTTYNADQTTTSSLTGPVNTINLVG